MRIEPLNGNTPLSTGLLPTNKINGDLVNATANAGFLTMPNTCVGVRNNAGTDVTINVVLMLADSTNTMLVTIPAGEVDTTIGAFNAVAVSGSTGHNSATTQYLLV